jgi:hypothetical protein
VLRNDQIQAAWIDYLKSKADILAELDDTDEIREDMWQGDQFTYPNIRVRLISNTPEEGRDCNLHSVTISTMAFSEDASSQQADRIAGIIMVTLQDTQFTSNGIAFGVRTTDLVPAIRSDDRTWRSEAIMSIRASG